MSESAQLKNKVIVVAGGSGLIGKAILAEAVKQLATVINIDLNSSGVEGIEEIRTDITKPESVKEVLSKIVHDSDRIDGLINTSYPRTANWSRETFEDLSLG